MCSDCSDVFWRFNKMSLRCVYNVDGWISQSSFCFGFGLHCIRVPNAGEPSLVTSYWATVITWLRLATAKGSVEPPCEGIPNSTMFYVEREFRISPLKWANSSEHIWTLLDHPIPKFKENWVGGLAEPYSRADAFGLRLQNSIGRTFQCWVDPI